MFKLNFQWLRKKPKKYQLVVDKLGRIDNHYSQIYFIHLRAKNTWFISENYNYGQNFTFANPNRRKA